MCVFERACEWACFFFIWLYQFCPILIISSRVHECVCVAFWSGSHSNYYISLHRYVCVWVSVFFLNLALSVLSDFNNFISCAWVCVCSVLIWFTLQLLYFTAPVRVRVSERVFSQSDSISFVWFFLIIDPVCMFECVAAQSRPFVCSKVLFLTIIIVLD